MKRKRGILVFMDMSTCKLTEGMNFITFLKENYAIGLYSCYFIFTKL